MTSSLKRARQPRRSGRAPRGLLSVGLLVAALGLGYLVGNVGRGTEGIGANETTGGVAQPTDSVPGAGPDPLAGPASGGPCDGRIDGPVELTLSAHSSDEAYVGAVASFNAGPGAELGVTVELLDLDETDYESFISGAASSSEFPDIVDLDGPFLPTFAEAGLVQPLGNCVDAYDLDDFLPSVLAQGRYEEEVYALASFDSGLGLWAKRSVLESVGARLPESPDDAWSVDELDLILRDLAASGIDAPLDIKWWYGAGEWRSFGFAPIIQSAGADLVDRTDHGAASGVINSPEAVGALTTLQTWVADGLVDLEATDDTNFTERDAALSWVGHWAYNSYRDALGDDLVLVPLPDFGRGSVTGLGSWSWAMSASTVDADAVWAFIAHVTSEEQVATIAQAEGAVPARRSVLDRDPSFQAGGDRHLYRQNLERVPEVARPRPQTPAYGAIREAFSLAFGEIVLGGDVQGALDSAAETIDREIKAAGSANTDEE